MLGLIPAGANDSVIKGGQDPNQWAVYGKDYANTRFSPLKSINTDNVAHLSLAYSFQLGSLRSNESTPLVIGDTMYVSTSWGPKYVYALDAATGAKKWTYEPEDIPDDVLQYACCDVANRGVAYADGKIFVGRLDGKLVALDAQTGKELWTADVIGYTQGAVITSPAGRQGQGHHRLRRRRIWRARLQAYDINTGKQVWKTYTVPLGTAQRRQLEGDSAHGGGRPGWSAPTIRRPTPFSGGQQPRSLELCGALDQQRRLRQTDQPLYGLDAGARRRQRKDQVVGAANAGRCMGL
jgi:glucose dehydrogenase